MNRSPVRASRRRSRPRHLAAATALIGVLALLGAVAPAAPAAGSRQLEYHGYRLTVPAGWPVYDLARSPSTCVRFDRHAVYVGTPGAGQRCPAHAAGRTEAILIEPLTAPGQGRSALPAPVAAADTNGGSAGRLLDRGHGVEVLASWHRRPDLIRAALGVRSLAALTGAARPRPSGSAVSSRVVPALAPDQSAAAAQASSARAAADEPAAHPADAIFTGPGFDACAAPSGSQMRAWSASPYRAIGVYLGGVNMACGQGNLTAGWLSAQTAAGWHAIPLYVGLQAPSNSCGCAAISPSSATSQGTAAAVDAVSQAQTLGLGPGNPVYFDMEAYPRGGTDSSAVLSFLNAWTARLHASGYYSGVYSSVDSGIADLVAENGSGFREPDYIWIANWNGAHTTSDASVPASDWPSHQRVHQYSGAHDETYGGVDMNIDGDYVDAAGAVPNAVLSSAPPALRVTPGADGSITVRPSWKTGPQLSGWQLLAGATPHALAAISKAFSGSSLTVHSAFRYFAVRALGPGGHVLGTSPPVATPAHVALIGTDAFVPARGLGAVPVACFSAAPCHITTTITAGRATLSATHAESVPVGGGLVFFRLTAASRRRLAGTGNRGLRVSVSVRDASGLSATRAMTLMPFRTSGAGPARRTTPSASVRVLDLTAFVSRGGGGGILAACASQTPCHVRATLTSGHTVLARTGTEFLGANELGYVAFSLTPTGYMRLTHARGNQLAARLSMSNGSDVATARLSLVAYG